MEHIDQNRLLVSSSDPIAYLFSFYRIVRFHIFFNHIQA